MSNTVIREGVVERLLEVGPPKAGWVPHANLLPTDSSRPSVLGSEASGSAREQRALVVGGSSSRDQRTPRLVQTGPWPSVTPCNPVGPESRGREEKPSALLEQKRGLGSGKADVAVETLSIMHHSHSSPLTRVICLGPGWPGDIIIKEA
jgi:hypothetical protein